MTERERLVELLIDSNYYTYEDQADYLLANGVIVPPCKVGDTVYRLDDFVWSCDCKECEHFEEGWYDSPRECGKTNSCRKSPECIEIEERVVTYRDILNYLAWEDFGKTVFLTREEAEAALEERSKDNG